MMIMRISCKKCGQFVGEGLHRCPTKKEMQERYNNPKTKKLLSDSAKEQWRTMRPKMIEATKNSSYQGSERQKRIARVNGARTTRTGKKVKCKVCSNVVYKKGYRLNKDKYDFCSCKCRAEFYKDDPELIKKISISSKEKWKDPEYREKTIKAQLKGLFKRPTSLEKQMIEIIKRNNLPYKYCGDGSFMIGFKNPDFVNVNGQKICIEVANIFHHPDPYIEQRKKHFAKYGWKCIIFRQDKLDENDVLLGIENNEVRNKC
jgi:hypothetical protein